MNLEFKPGDIVKVIPTKYTTALIIKTWKVIEHVKWGWYNPGETLYAKLLPFWDTFPIGRFLYEDRMDRGWIRVKDETPELLDEAKRVLKLALDSSGIDNLTFVEILNKLNERIKPQ